MQTADEIIVKLTADNSGINAELDEVAAKVKASTDTMRASVAEAMSQFTAFDAIQKSSIKTSQDLSAAQAALSAVQQSGAYTTEELAAKQAILDAAMAKLPKELEAASAATIAFTGNTRVMGEVSTIISEAMAGNFGRIRRSAAALANQSGILTSIFSPLGVVVAETAAALGGLVYFTARAEEYQGELSQSLLVTSGAAGMSKDQLVQLTEDLQSYGTHASNAREIILGLTNSGRIGFDQMGDASRVASELVQITGINAEQAVKKLVEMGDDPVRAARSLEEQMGFLTQKQADEIASLEKAGEKSQAFSVLLEALRGHLEDVDRQTQATTTRLEAFLHDLNPYTWGQAWEDGAHNIGVALDKAIDGPSLQDKFNKARDQYFALVNEAKAHPVPWMESLDTGGKGFAVAIEEARQKAYALQQQLEKVNQAAKAAGAAAQQVKGGVLNTLGGNKGSASSDDSAATKADKDEFDQEQLIHKMSLDAERAYWEQKRAIAQQYGRSGEEEQAVRELLQIREKADTAATASARKAAAAQRQFQDSTTNEVLADIRKEAEAQAKAMQQVIADAQETARASIAAAQGGYDLAADAIKAKLDLGQTSAQQEIAELEQSEQRKYQIELAALQDELKLVQMKPEVAKKVNDQIEALERAHNLRMQQLNEQSAKDYQKTWQDRLKPVTQAFSQSINGMIQGTLTLKQAEMNMLQSILAKFIETGIDTLSNAIANQEGLSAAAAAGAAQRVTIAKTAAAETKTAEASTAQSQIMTAAATAAAKAYQAIVGIPYVGPILAPIAAGVAFAGVEAFTADIASAEGGWERVPADGMMTRLHYNEMVLPAHVAEPVRQMAKNGGNGGGVHHHHYSITMNDAHGVRRLIQKNGSEIAAGIRHLSRRGHRL